MPSAIIGTGKIGTAVATHLAEGGESVILASRTAAQAGQLAIKLGARATATGITDAIEQSDAVLLGVWLDAMKELIRARSRELAGKVAIDPSNPVAPDGKGGLTRRLPDGVSSGSVVAALLPQGAHFVKAFGTVSAETLAAAANPVPAPGVLFYATDDDTAAAVVKRLISAAGFDPVKVGGLDQTIRTEGLGDLHQYGGLKGKLLAVAEARRLLGRP